MSKEALIEAVENADLTEDERRGLLAVLRPGTPAPWVPALALPPEVAARIEAGEPDADRRKALTALAIGVPLKQALSITGTTGVAGEVWQQATSMDLVDLSGKTMMAGKARIAILADQELEQRLSETPEKVTNLELNAISGTATDKLFRSQEGIDQSDKLAAVVKLLRTQPKVTIEVEAQPFPAAITPVEDDDAS